MTVNPTRRALLTAGGLSLASIALAGCTGGSAGTGGGSGGGGSKSINAFNGGSGQFTNGFNPFLPTATNPGFRGMVYEPLMFFNQSKANDIQPWLAKSYELSKDGRTITFTLKSGVTWTDGTPFTSKDVVYTFGLIKKYPALNTNGLVFDSITAPDDATVVIRTGRPAFTDLWYLAGQTYIVPEHLWTKVSDPTTEANTKPVGTGAFTLQTFSAQSFLMKKNPTYHEGSVSLESVRFVSYSGNGPATAALIAGQLDWAGIFIPDVQKAFVSRDPKNNHYQLATSTLVTYLVPNLTKFPLSELPVRRAMNVAIDRETLNKQAFSGYNLQPSRVLTLTPRDDQYVAAAFRGPIGFDTAGAKKILTSAGYKQGADGIFADGQGRKVTMKCLVITGYTDYISALQLIGENLKAAGIGFSSQEVSLASFGVSRSQGQFDILIDAAAGGPGVFYLYNTLLNSKLTAPVGKTATSDFARFQDAKVDQLLGQMASTADQTVITKAAQDIQAIVAERVPYVALVQRTDLVEYRTANVSGFPAKDDPYAGAGPSGSPDVGIVARRLKPV